MLPLPPPLLIRLEDVKRNVVRYALVHMLHCRWGEIRLKKINGDVERTDVIRTYLYVVYELGFKCVLDHSRPDKAPPTWCAGGRAR